MCLLIDILMCFDNECDTDIYKVQERLANTTYIYACQIITLRCQIHMLQFRCSPVTYALRFLCQTINTVNPPPHHPTHTLLSSLLQFHQNMPSGFCYCHPKVAFFLFPFFPVVMVVFNGIVVAYIQFLKTSFPHPPFLFTTALNRISTYASIDTYRRSQVSQRSRCKIG